MQPDAPPSAAPSEAPPGAGSTAPQVPPRVEPPQILSQVEPAYPEAELETGASATVGLSVTVDANGAVTEVVVTSSAGLAFDQAAVNAVRTWRFQPATRDGQAIASRISVSVAFTPPSAATAQPEPVTGRVTAPEKRAAQAEPGAVRAKERRSVSEPTPPRQQPVVNVDVHGERKPRTEQRSASDFSLHNDVLASAPRREGAEVLRAVPGLHLSRGEGLAVAHGYVLRGFDAEHGQDIEFRVGGLPINLPSHVHGQGYADLGFLIDEAVHEVHATEGLSDPRQGDFAVAGSIDVDLGVDEPHRGLRLRSGYGSFDTFNQLVLWSPKDASRDSFAGVQLSTTNGYGQNRAGTSGSALFQHRFGAPDLSVRAIGIVHGARSNLAGVVRQDDIDEGTVCFDCVYPYPTAQAQAATSQRVMVGAFVDSYADDGANGQLGFWAGKDSFHLLENLTGFQQRSRTLADVSGRGDLVEQANDTDSMGLTARYRTAPFHPAAWAVGVIEVGSDARMDRIEQAQNLLDGAVRNEVWDRRIDAGISGSDVGVWGDLEFGFLERIRARLGARADVLTYDIDDRLQNYAPVSRPTDTYIVGFRRTAHGLAAGPRSSLEYHPLPWLTLLAAYGEGYRSPQARQLEEGESAPYTRVRSADSGVRLTFDDELELLLSGYFTQLSDDIAFDAEESRLERIGATRRMGAVAHALYRPGKWGLASVSATFVDARLLEPPPPSVEEPDPPFRTGQRLPFVPPLVVRADVTGRATLIRELPLGQLDGKLGLGYSFLSARPLPYGEFTEPLSLLDASATLEWLVFDLSFQAFNLLDLQYAESESVHPSSWDPDGVRSRVPARHISAGPPRAFMLQLGATL